MQEQLEQRLEDLKSEFDRGRKTLAGLEAEQNNIRNSLLRISGAIQVLEEELARFNGGNGENLPLADTTPVEAEVAAPLSYIRA